MQKGLKVYRTLESYEIGQKNIPVGSFIIKNRSTALNKLIADLSVSPIYLPDETSAKMTEMVMPKVGLVETNFHDMQRFGMNNRTSSKIRYGERGFLNGVFF